VNFASEYFEREIPLEIVSLVYHHEVLTETVVKRLNHDADLSVLEPELSSIGYPSA
jgi:hypothetical protein